MNKPIMTGLVLLLLSMLIAPSAFAQDGFDFIQSPTTRAYLPGDVVHVIIGAPPDTAQIVATMPDDTQVTLNYDRRTYTWHGNWEVPYGLKKGFYYAKIRATDVEGRSYDGVTGNFYIGEPALVTLIGLQTTRETAVTNEKQMIQKLQSEVSLLLKEAAKRPPERAIEKTIERPGSSVSAPRPRRPADVSLIKARLVERAKYFLNRGDYRNARAQLSGLVRIEPDNPDIKRLLKRLNEVIKAKELR